MVYRVDRAAADGKRGEEKSAETGGVVRAAALGKPTRVKPPTASFDIRLPLDADSGRETLRVTVNYYYCREGAEGLCKVGSAAWIVPVEVVADAVNSAIPLQHRAR